MAEDINAEEFLKDFTKKSYDLASVFKHSVRQIGRKTAVREARFPLLHGYEVHIALEGSPDSPLFSGHVNIVQRLANGNFRTFHHALAWYEGSDEDLESVKRLMEAVRSLPGRLKAPQCWLRHSTVPNTGVMRTTIEDAFQPLTRWIKALPDSYFDAAELIHEELDPGAIYQAAHRENYDLMSVFKPVEGKKQDWVASIPLTGTVRAEVGLNYDPSWDAGTLSAFIVQKMDKYSPHDIVRTPIGTVTTRTHNNGTWSAYSNLVPSGDWKTTAFPTKEAAATHLWGLSQEHL